MKFDYRCGEAIFSPPPPVLSSESVNNSDNNKIAFLFCDRKRNRLENPVASENTGEIS